MIVGIGLLLATVVYPATMLTAKCFESMPEGTTTAIDDARDTTGGFASSLFLRSAGLAALGATAACVFALPGIRLVGGTVNARQFGLATSLIIAPLVLPPIVIGLGVRSWIRGVSEIRCVIVWGLWCWPIAALLVGGAWARRGHQLYEVALLHGGKFKAFKSVLGSVLVRPIVGVWMLMFALFLGDYSVPHSCDMIAYATALLSEATSSPYPVATVIAGFPLLAPMLVAVVVAYLVGGRAEASDQDEPAKAQAGFPRVTFALVLAMITVSTLLPTYGLIRNIALIKAIATTWELYRTDIAYSLATAFIAGLMIVWMGICVTAIAPIRRIAPLLVLIWAVVPGALVGQAVVAAYLPIDVIYSHWMLTVVGYVARFGWIGVLLAYVVVKQSDEATMGAAMVDGASTGFATCRVTFANHWPTMCAGVLIATAMSLAEIATTTLVRVPVFSPVSLILIEKFHRFEDDILAAICILLLVVACPGIAIFSLASRWGR